MQAIFRKPFIVEKRLSQLSCADDDGVAHVVAAQKGLQILHQLGNDIADAGPPRLAHRGQILADLNFTHMQRRGDGRG